MEIVDANKNDSFTSEQVLKQLLSGRTPNVEVSDQCGNCGSTNASVACRNSCGGVFYCDISCQLNHASAHRRLCTSTSNQAISDSDSDTDSEIEDNEDRQSFEKRVADNLYTRLQKEEDQKIVEAVEKQLSKPASKKRNNGRDIKGIMMAVRSAVENKIAGNVKNRVTPMNLPEEEICTSQPKDNQRSLQGNSERGFHNALCNNPNGNNSENTLPLNNSKNDLFSSKHTNYSGDNARSLNNTSSKDDLFSSKYTNNSGDNARPLNNSKNDLFSCELTKYDCQIPVKRDIDSTSNQHEIEHLTTFTVNEKNREIALSGKHFLNTRSTAEKEFNLWSSSCNEFLETKFYVWRGGAVGFYLRDDNQNHIIVDSVDKYSTAWEDGITSGDILQSIGGTNCAGMDSKQAISFLVLCDIPTILRLISSDTENRERYSVDWENGKLGVTFKSDGEECIPVVHRMTSRVDSVAKEYGIYPGDVLVSINGVDTIKLGCQHALTTLMTLSLPAKLVFQRYIRKTRMSELSNFSDLSNGSCDIFSQSSCSSLSDRDSSLSNLGRLSDESKKTIKKPINKAITRIFADEGLSLPSPNAFGRSVSNPEKNLTLSTHKKGVNQVSVIEWREGLLGLTLFEHPQTGVPVVNRLTGKGNSVGLENIQHGYTLYSINGVTIQNRTFESICDSLKIIKKPIILIFRSPDYSGNCSSSSTKLSRTKSLMNMRYSRKIIDECADVDTEYEVLWKGGPLGLEMGFSHHEQHEPYIASIQPECTLRFRSNATGDSLVAVNNMHTRNLDSHGLSSMLADANKPTVLRFRSKIQLSRVSHESNISCNSEEEDEMDDCYNIVWHEGELGIKFTVYEYDSQQVHVKRVAGGCAGRIGIVSVGDILANVNGRPIPQGQSLRETMNNIASIAKPIVLGFERFKFVHPANDGLKQPSLRRINSVL